MERKGGRKRERESERERERERDSESEREREGEGETEGAWSRGSEFSVGLARKEVQPDRTVVAASSMMRKIYWTGHRAKNLDVNVSLNR